MISPPATIVCASTDGTNKTLIGCSGEPMAGIGSAVGGGGSVGAGGWVGGGAEVGAAVGAACAQAPRTMATATSRLRTKNRRFLPISLPSSSIIVVIAGWGCAERPVSRGTHLLSWGTFGFIITLFRQAGKHTPHLCVSPMAVTILDPM